MPARGMSTWGASFSITVVQVSITLYKLWDMTSQVRLLPPVTHFLSVARELKK